MRHDIVRTRPLTPADGQALARFYSGLSPLTIHARFFVDSLRDLGPMDRLGGFDQQRHLAVAAEEIRPAGADIIGVAHAVVAPEDPACAEFAIVVADRWQGRGIGLVLTRRLALDSRRSGITHWRLVRLTGNDRVDRVVAAVATRVSIRESGGVVEAVHRLHPASVEVG